MFQKSYKEHIKAWKKISEPDELTSKKIIHNAPAYTEYLVDLSSRLPDYESTKWWYNKTQGDHYSYELEEKLFDHKDEIRKDTYHELRTIWLKKIYRLSYITDDFFTGYFLAKLLLPNTSSISSLFHFGYTNRHITTGFLHCAKNMKKRVEIYGADNYRANTQYLNGITKDGNLLNPNTLKSIRNQISGKTDKLTYYICDINPKTNAHLYNSLAIALSDVSDTSVIRLPELHNWDTCIMINFFILVLTQFDTVMLFKTPWGSKPRYYLILSDNDPLNTAEMTKYMCFLTALAKNKKLNLYPKYALEEELRKPVTEQSILLATILEINNKIRSLVKINTQTNPAEVNTIWIEKIMGETFDDIEQTENEIDSPRPNFVKK